MPAISAGDNGTLLRVESPDHTEDPAYTERFPLHSVSDAGELELPN